MLLKFVKTSNAAGAGSSSSNSTTLSARGTGMRMTMSTASTMSSRIHRKGFRIPNKRHPGKAIPSKLHSINRPISGKLVPGKRLPQRPHPPHCDNSNDSGLGFDQHVDQSAAALANNSSNNNSTHISNLNLNHTSGSSTSSAASCSSSTSSSSSSSSSTSTNLPTNALQMQQQQQRHDLQAQQPQQAPHPHHLQQQQSHHHSHFQQHSHHNKHQAHHQHHHQQQQASTSAASGSSLHHSPQQQQQNHHHHQHLIRAIPASRFISAGKRGLIRVANKRQPAVPQNSIAASQNGQVQLEIMLQPEQQHRARYQTEGSRGAVKDRSGNGFPIVRLTGYNKPTVLQVFIGTDVGRVAPHMFYQACKVAGKNSTQCNERKVDGTMVIEIDFKPETEMTVTCDCVGILKERNVDVEHRFPDHLAQKNKKKSTRCRMVFRTEITHDDGTTETLQVCSNPIICTQPPGVPEICKKSLNSCPVDGGLELFIIGKNFLKDTQVIFQETYDYPNNDNGSSAAVTSAAATAAQDLQMQPLAAGVVDTATPAAATTATLWEQTVLPDKEYLQQTHLICTVPPYIHQNIMKPITVQVSIISSGKKSESHSFVYTPKGSYTKLAAATALSIPFNGSGSLSAAQAI